MHYGRQSTVSARKRRYVASKQSANALKGLYVPLASSEYRQSHRPDAIETEPLPYDHPNRRLDNVVTTPHLGYVSAQNYGKYFPDIVEDIRAWLDGKPVRVIAP